MGRKLLGKDDLKTPFYYHKTAGENKLFSFLGEKILRLRREQKNEKPGSRGNPGEKSKKSHRAPLPVNGGHSRAADMSERNISPDSTLVRRLLGEHFHDDHNSHHGDQDNNKPAHHQKIHELSPKPLFGRFSRRFGCAFLFFVDGCGHRPLLSIMRIISNCLFTY
jgi:hypothetical protein